MKPLISIIITVHKRLDFLRAAIDSALGQSFLDREVIVADDSGCSARIIAPYYWDTSYYKMWLLPLAAFAVMLGYLLAIRYLLCRIVVGMILIIFARWHGPKYLDTACLQPASLGFPIFGKICGYGIVGVAGNMQNGQPAVSCCSLVITAGSLFIIFRC